MSKTFNQENIVVQESSLKEEVKAICAGKMHQIHTKIDKKI